MKGKQSTYWYKWFIPSAILFIVALLFTRHKLKSIPSYGVKGWRKLVLAKMLTEDAPAISTLQAKQASGKAIFLDVRTPGEFNTSHIADARFIDYKNFTLQDVSELDKNATIILYCSIGKRSSIITQKMVEAGFTNVYNLYGGIFTWFNNGYPVVDNQQQLTNRIHAYNQAWGLFLKRGYKVVDTN